MKYRILLLLCLWAFFCCSDPSDWYPTGIAEIVSFYEEEDGLEKICHVTYRLYNDGISVISLSTLTVSVETDAKTYYNTLVNETAILPERSIWGIVSLSFHDISEVTSREKITITDSFFE